MRRLIRALPAFVLLAATQGASAAESTNVHGVVLPGDAQKVGENRYRTSEDWDGLIKKFFKTVYPEPQFPRKSIMNQPGIKALHIAFPSSRTWEGINIYQANDEIRIFLVPADSRGKKKSGKK
jgi:hypothetical protein